MTAKCSALLVLVVANLFPALATQAATVADDPVATLPKGRPMAQHFLSTGASVVITPEDALCVVSSQIEIAASRYVAPDGAVVPFGDVVRSVASSVQAMAGAGLSPPDFRMQLKYSLKPGVATWLDLGDGGRVDISGLVEPSTDSFLITGDLALRLAAAFREGQSVTLAGVSSDTGRTVIDQLVSPDLNVLSACQATLAADVDEPPQLAALVTLDFVAAPTPDSRATVEEMRACAMAPTDRPVHLGRIRGTTGFFSQTEKVFVAFNDAGQPERVYVPGILDAGMDDLGMGEARISRAADANTPGDENAVKGCLGAASQEICVRPVAGDREEWQLRPCWLVPTEDQVSRSMVDPLQFTLPPETIGLPLDSPLRSGPPVITPPGSLPPVLERLPVVPFKPSPFDTPTGGGPRVTNPPIDPPPPVPVPLPATGLFLLGGLVGLFAMRRRRTT